MMVFRVGGIYFALLRHGPGSGGVMGRGRTHYGAMMHALMLAGRTPQGVMQVPILHQGA
jgi:hypothetical protein